MLPSIPMLPIRFWLIILPVLTGCTSGTPPENQWEMAVQGAYSAALSQQGENLLIGSVHHGGSYWQVSPQERLFDWNHKAEEKTGLLAVGISDDGKYAATAEHRKIVLWNAQTGEAFWLWEAPANIQDLDLASDGSLALLGMDNYQAALFDIQNGGVKQRLLHEGIVQAVDMSADLKWAISGGDDSKVKIWNLESGKAAFEWELDNQIKVVAISDNGRMAFASSHRGQNIIWDTTTGKQISALPTISGYYLAARFNKSGDQLLTGNSSGQVQLWKTGQAELINTWRATPRNPWIAQNTQVLDVAFTNSGYRAIGANGITYEFKGISIK